MIGTWCKLTWSLGTQWCVIKPWGGCKKWWPPCRAATPVGTLANPKLPVGAPKKLAGRMWTLMNSPGPRHWKLSTGIWVIPCRVTGSDMPLAIWRINRMWESVFWSPGRCVSGLSSPGGGDHRNSLNRQKMRTKYGGDRITKKQYSDQSTHHRITHWLNWYNNACVKNK